MKVKFTSDQSISYNGVAISSYASGDVYKATHERERAFFKSALASGVATLHDEVETDKAHPVKSAERKVLTPKNKK